MPGRLRVFLGAWARGGTTVLWIIAAHGKSGRPKLAAWRDITPGVECHDHWVGPTEVGPGQVLRRRCTAGAKVHQRSRNGVVNCLRPGYRVA